MRRAVEFSADIDFQAEELLYMFNSYSLARKKFPGDRFRKGAYWKIFLSSAASPGLSSSCFAMAIMAA